MRVDIGATEVVKQAESPSEAGQLAVEAETLTTWSHPGLVRLVRRSPAAGETVDELVTATAGGGSLADVDRPPIDLLAGWSAAVVTVLGDLHSVGLAHGAVNADHIILDSDGRPLLCGLGHAVRREDSSDFDAACSTDLRALASLLIKLAPPGRETDRLARRLARWERSLGRRPNQSHGNDLASAIVDAVPSARVGLPESPPADDSAELASPTSPGTWPASISRAAGALVAGFGWRRTALVGIVALGLAGAVVVWGGQRSAPSAPVAAGSSASSDRGLSPSAGGPSSPAAASASSVPPSETVADIIPGYQLKTPGAGRALTVLGRWGCGRDRPAVLYLGNGTVWVFPSWPTTGTAVGAIKTATVAGATGLAVQGGSPGCDNLLVLRGAKAPVTVAAGPGQ